MKTLKQMTRKALLTLTLAALGAGAIPAQAHAFYVQPSVFVTPSQVEASVVNHSMQTLRCRVQVQGVTASGRWANAWADLILPPGGMEYAYVYSTYEPFMSGQAQAQCVFLGGYGYGYGGYGY